MDKLSDLCVCGNNQKELILYDDIDDLERGLSHIAEYWMTFELEKHKLYKIADDKKDPWSRCTKVVVRSLDEAANTKDYNNIIVINPDLSKHQSILERMKTAHPDRFHLVLENHVILKYLEDDVDFDPKFLIKALRWTGDCEKPKRRKRHFIINSDGDSEEGSP
jgi:hypothetical protein